MDEADWIELEYTQLRAEILALMAVEQSAIRFYLPAAAAVYTVPYILNDTSQPYLWTVCGAAGGLLGLALVHSLAECSEGVRRIGSYIKEVLEPRTAGGLRWESTLFELYKTPAFHPSETLIIATSLVAANIVAAFVAGLLFLPVCLSWLPGVVALVFGVLARKSIARISKTSPVREEYTAKIRQLAEASRRSGAG